MNRYLCLFIGLVLTLFAGGCVVSEQPLSTISEAKPDPRLTGQWHKVEGDAGEKKAEINDKEKPEIAQISFDGHGVGHAQNVEKDGKLGLEILRFFVTRTERNTFLNIQDPSGDFSGYYFFKYQVSEDGKELKLWSVHDFVLVDAVKAGQLKGKLDVHPPGKNSSLDKYTLLQDSPDKILSFIEAKTESAIYDRPMTLEKVK